MVVCRANWGFAVLSFLFYIQMEGSDERQYLVSLEDVVKAYLSFPFVPSILWEFNTRKCLYVYVETF